MGVPGLAGRARQPCEEASYHLMLRLELAFSTAW